MSAREAPFVQVTWGERFVQRPLSALSDAISSMLWLITALSGLSCTRKTNKNFDYFYAMLPSFRELRLADYFISSDMNSVYLLWRET